MSPRMSQGCALVLLLAMVLAMAVGMMAWGPMQLQASDHQFADSRTVWGLAQAMNALACLPLLAASAWGVTALRRSAWPAALRTPWFAFFALAAAMSGCAALYHLQPGDAGYALTHAFAAGALTMLALAFMAERMDPLFGSVPAVLGGCAVAGFAALWWFAGEWASGRGDLRAVIFLECLPLLLMPSGALSLAGRHTAARDWLAMLGLYVLARAAGLADQAVRDALGVLSGHTLMHLLLGGVVAWAAYRVGVAPGTRPLASASASAPEPTQRRTSLNTSS